ncbi:methionine--tRNA ligase [Gloeobacter kilaueensis]|uniref:Methionine--tRNA ligase n=1 Tax=Gloeobacter kilaueensis (strain ATCC BAA-2537 / CCAP 1431/1 / ULC 316 / JS1) TaxID=1183438 RepID=U5QEX3_GLOK1|nr:methionine--tRNA ligase [Gloeobacter kilaueensis]AGY57507.1 methionyl-tRNA synthetase [Gloeobacter kilaueensis JS1]
MTKGFALTTPLYYVNALPHIGSAYPTMAADAVARYYRLRGVPVRFVTGTDEHGLKIERRALERGLSPKAHSDEIASGFEQLWQLLSIHYDRFIRTTDPRHKPIVREFFERCWQAGDIYKGRYSGLYCVDCEEFKRPDDLYTDEKTGQSFCKIHSKPVREQDEENYIFALSRYQERLERYYDEHPYFIQPDFRSHEVRNFVAQGLEDFSISRANVEWGLPLPVDPSQTIYVWFDALIGYITALLEPDDEPTLENALARWWPIDLHIVGKDILRFHAIYWPAMLMSAELPLPGCIFGHGFLTRDGKKMGKAAGNVIDPDALARQYGTDAVRYYFLKEIEFGRDNDFSEERFRAILNADLANDLGNLLNRTVNMVARYCGGVVPSVVIEPSDPLREQAAGLPALCAEHWESLRFSEAAAAVLYLVRSGNKYLDTQAPWALFKKGEQAQVEQVLYAVLESVRIAAVLLSPLIPALAAEIYRQLGFADRVWENLTWEAAQWGGLPPDQPLRPGAPLFARLD